MREELIYHGRIFDMVRIDGKWDAIKHPGAVFVVPVIDLATSNILAIQTIRPVIGEICWEIPAGLLESNEQPTMTAYRELLEETGYHANRIIPLGGPYYSSYGCSNEKCHFFAAMDLVKTSQLPDGEAEVVTVMNSELLMEKVQSATNLLALMLFHQAVADGRIVN